LGFAILCVRYLTIPLGIIDGGLPGENGILTITIYENLLDPCLQN